MKAISQMTQGEKLQTISEYTPCKIEREIVLRYLWRYAVTIYSR